MGDTLWKETMVCRQQRPGELQAAATTVSAHVGEIASTLVDAVPQQGAAVWDAVKSLSGHSQCTQRGCARHRTERQLTRCVCTLSRLFALHEEQLLVSLCSH